MVTRFSKKKAQRKRCSVDNVKMHRQKSETNDLHAQFGATHTSRIENEELGMNVASHSLFGYKLS